jgi:hypothetical protein
MVEAVDCHKALAVVKVEAVCLRHGRREDGIDG